jgi:hypothetical protein
MTFFLEALSFELLKILQNEWRLVFVFVAGLSGGGMKSKIPL